MPYLPDVHVAEHKISCFNLGFVVRYFSIPSRLHMSAFIVLLLLDREGGGQLESLAQVVVLYVFCLCFSDVSYSWPNNLIYATLEYVSSRVRFFGQAKARLNHDA